MKRKQQLSESKSINVEPTSTSEILHLEMAKMAWSVYMQKINLNSIASFSLMYSLTVIPTEDSVSVLWVYYMEGSNLMSKDKLNSFTRMLCCYRFYVSDCNLVRELWKAKTCWVIKNDICLVLQSSTLVLRERLHDVWLQYIPIFGQQTLCPVTARIAKV